MLGRTRLQVLHASLLLFNRDVEFSEIVESIINDALHPSLIAFGRLPTLAV